MSMNLNGLKVKTIPVSEGGDGKTKFIQLPRHFWKEIGGPTCKCKYCIGKTTSYWDTMAVSDSEYTWTVHMPENHPEGLKANETRLPYGAPFNCND